VQSPLGCSRNRTPNCRSRASAAEDRSGAGPNGTPCRAIVVPNTRVAYLARIAFGEGDYRVFYNDFLAAIRWL